MQENAYAKINLSLEVLGRRADGYHSVLTVMQMISLHDTLRFSPANDLKIESNRSALVRDPESNMVIKAARLLQDTTGTNKGAHIYLEKRIPVASGMGGGSSDAAAALRGLASLWGLDLRRDEMLYMAARLGSDVPFFFHGPTAMGEGRGDVMTPISSMPPTWVVLVCPRYDLQNKTESLYGSLTTEDQTRGALTMKLVANISRGKFPAPELLHNAFERAAVAAFPGLENVIKQITTESKKPLHLSGSGPTLYTLYPEAQESEARSLYWSLQAAGLPVYLATTLAA